MEQSSQYAMNHPIHLVVEDDLLRNRLTVFFRLLLAIPHFIWLLLWGIAALLAAIGAWFVALFTGRVSDGLHNFLAQYTRYEAHVYAYVMLVADPYPGFTGVEGSYPVDVHIAPPTTQNRLTVAFRIILAIPALVIAYVINYLSQILVFFAWFICLALARMPEGMRNLLAFTLRYHLQTQAYLRLLTQRYPSLNVRLE
jgi:uncharacterized protein DUF4389